MISKQAEERPVVRKAERLHLRDGYAAMSVGAREAHHVALGEEAVPASEGRVGRIQQPQERVAMVQTVKSERREYSQSNGSPFAITVHELEPPGPGQIPAGEAQIVTRAQ